MLMFNKRYYLFIYVFHHDGSLLSKSGIFDTILAMVNPAISNKLRDSTGLCRVLPRWIRPVSNVVLLPCRTPLIELNLI